MHQDVGERGEVEPQLIDPQGGVAGAVGEQAELLLLDAVLDLAPGAVEFFVEASGIGPPGAEAGDHEPRFLPLGRCSALPTTYRVLDQLLSVR